MTVLWAALAATFGAPIVLYGPAEIAYQLKKRRDRVKEG